MSGDVSKCIFVITSIFDDVALKKQRCTKSQNNSYRWEPTSKLNDDEYNIGVQIQNTYKVKKVDEDFFELG